MNKLLKYFVYSCLTIHFSIVSYELVRIFFTSIPKYLLPYDLSYNKLQYIKFVICKMLKLLSFYLIMFIVNLKSKDEHVKDPNISEDSVILDLQNLNESVQSSYNDRWERTSRFIKSNRALLSVYLYLISIDLDTFNPILYVIAPYLMYKILYKLYSRHKYTKIFFWSAISTIAAALYKFLAHKKSKSQIIENDKLPKEIMRYLIKNGYEVVTFNIESDVYNVGVIEAMNNVSIFIFGNIWEIFTDDEFTSVLYHEIGHVVNKSLLSRMLISKALDIFMYVIEFFMIYKNRSLLKQDNTSNTDEDRDIEIKNIICLYVILCISISPFINMINNIYSFIDESEADLFSVKNFDRKHLISALIKFTVENKANFDSSLLFNFMYFTHPCLKRRVELINEM
ncbi:CAAX prenyl protease domain-containing protein [Vairimorpha necatrix]|uniref:CAAX prenyl protease domain-containing protein n=1 Tax=Vairimorpha necatrix TaxID=6039 RepID=A0AAX4JBS8_9MICR